MKTNTFWKIITLIELIAAAAVIYFDLFLPTLVILAMIVISLLIRHEHISTLGFKRPESWPRLILFALLGVFAMQLVDTGVTKPILMALTGATVDYSGFASLKGNVSQLFTLLFFSWTLAALGEEMVYRGYLQKRLTDLFGDQKFGVLLAIGISSLLFGLAHTEQGIAGVIITTCDALFFSWLKRKFNNNLWASILAHGFYNSIGVIIFFFTGPIDRLW